jgi:signal peptidase I
MPTQTLERRPRNIPRRCSRGVDPTGTADITGTPLRRRAHEPIRVPAPAPVDHDARPRGDDEDPDIGLTRAERKARRYRASRHGRRRHLAVDILVLLLVAVALWFTWPARFGGAATFVVVHGHSMDPTFRSGDVVLVRRAGSYHVGEIAAYHIPKGQAGAGQGVIHRIRKVEDGHYTFRGDNRSTEDQWHPTAKDILGREVLRIPMPGETFWAILPWFWCAAIGVVVTWMFWPTDHRRRGQRATPS